MVVMFTSLTLAFLGTVWVQASRKATHGREIPPGMAFMELSRISTIFVEPVVALLARLVEIAVISSGAAAGRTKHCRARTFRMH